MFLLECKCRACTEQSGRFNLCDALRGVFIVLVIAAVYSFVEAI